MLSHLFAYEIDTFIFMGIALVGFAVLVVTLLLGEVAEVAGDVVGDVVGDSDSDFSDADADEALPLLNLKVMIAGMTGLGVVGWIATGYFGVAPFYATLMGLGGGALLMVPASLMYRAFTRTQASSGFSEASLVGATARVSLPIPVDGVGRIQLSVKGSTISGTARRWTDGDGHGARIPQGALVRVRQVLGGEYYVEEAS